MSHHPSRDPADLADFVSQITDHQTALRGYLQSLIPHAQDVRDVLQETNLVLWERRQEFRPGTNFRAWAFTIARYRALDYRKKLKKNRRLVFDEELVELLGTQPYDWAPELVSMRKAALRSCLQGLKPKDRALINARYAGDTRLEDHAVVDGRSPGSLRVILNRLRAALRRCIDDKLAEEGGAF